MKKILFSLMLLLGITLTGCIPTVEEPNDDILLTYTEEELIALIEELLPEATIESTYDLASFEEAVNQMVEDTRTGVLGVAVETALGTGSGSGVIYKKEGNTYYLVTNEHVVESALTITIVYEKNGLLFEISDQSVTLVGADVTTDLAVITFESEEDFSVIPIADSYQVELGDVVFAVGNPLGFEYYGTVTMGVISGLARYVNDGLIDGFDATLLQHDAAISPGNSGGALLNLNGELVGINNMKIVDDNVTSIGFAIPSNTVNRIVTDLEDDGEISTPFLGISTYAQVNVCGLDYGVCITVTPDLPADLAGLQDDDVIIGYRNEGMVDYLEINNFNDLREAILNSSVGETIQLKYVRNGIEYISEPVELIERP
jgi:serine protease Do